MRRDKVNYFLDIAETVSERSTCLKRRWGSIIVKDNMIISSGYNGSPRGMLSCLDIGKCNRVNSQRGTDYSNCPAVHSEVNAILHAGRDKTLGADLYLCGLEYVNDAWVYTKDPNSCTSCRRLIINAGIKNVYIRLSEDDYKIISVKEDWMNNIKNILGGY